MPGQPEGFVFNAFLIIIFEIMKCGAGLEFQACSYGTCQECDVFTGLFCLTPCSTYTTFTKPTRNHIMQRCAQKLGISWPGLVQCANGTAADALQRASAGVCRARGMTYGTKGLPVVTIGAEGAPPSDAVVVHTTQKIPLFCGPTPMEVLKVICSAYQRSNAGQAPTECATTEVCCTLVLVLAWHACGAHSVPPLRSSHACWICASAATLWQV